MPHRACTVFVTELYDVDFADNVAVRSDDSIGVLDNTPPPPPPAAAPTLADEDEDVSMDPADAEDDELERALAQAMEGAR